jgi:kynureninase
MKKGFKPMSGADGWQLSNINVLSSAAHLAALSIFEEAGIDNLRTKSIRLTGFLEFLLKQIPDADNKLKILTPSDPEARGCQLSLFFSGRGRRIHEALESRHVLCDYRDPDVVRIAPTPLYNTFEEVYIFYEIINEVLNEG